MMLGGTCGVCSAELVLAQWDPFNIRRNASIIMNHISYVPGCDVV